MRMPPPMVWCLNSSSTIGGTVWEGLGGAVLLEMSLVMGLGSTKSSVYFQFTFSAL